MCVDCMAKDLNDLNYSYKSANRRGHSTKTTPLKVHRLIDEALDQGSTTALIILDLVAAFDVIDQPITNCLCIFGQFNIDNGYHGNSLHTITYKTITY